MNFLILAAGYGTRLQKDVVHRPEYSHLKNLPKALVPIASKPLVSHWIQIFTDANIPLSNVYIVTNAVFYAQFKQWASECKFRIENILGRPLRSSGTHTFSAHSSRQLVTSCYLPRHTC